MRLRVAVLRRFVGAIFALSAWTWVYAHEGLDVQIDQLTADIKKSPDDPLLRLRRADLYRVERDWQHAAEDIQSARKLENGGDQADFVEGMLWYDADVPLSALPLLSRYIQRHPDDVNALRYRARTLVRLKRFTDALTDFRRFSAIPPYSPEAYIEWQQAVLLFQPTALDAALAVLNEGIQRVGPAAQLLDAAIALDMQRADVDSALKHWDMALNYPTNKASWYTRRGELLLAASRWTAATEAFATAKQELSKLPLTRRESAAMTSVSRRIEAGLVAAQGRQPHK